MLAFTLQITCLYSSEWYEPFFSILSLSLNRMILSHHIQFVIQETFTRATSPGCFQGPVKTSVTVDTSLNCHLHCRKFPFNILR